MFTNKYDRVKEHMKTLKEETSMLKFFSVLLIFGFILGGCSDATITQQNSENPSPSEDVNNETNGTTTFEIGDVVIYNDLQIKLLGARIIEDDYLTPEKNKFLAIELEVINNGKESVHLSTIMNMSLISNGYEMGHALISGKGSLDSQISPGRGLKGEVVFDVADADFYEFVFEDGFSNGQVIWVINNEEINE
jgi:hypothetical protein